MLAYITHGGFRGGDIRLRALSTHLIDAAHLAQPQHVFNTFSFLSLTDKVAKAEEDFVETLQYSTFAPSPPW